MASTFDIIIATYKRPDKLSQTLDSIKNQTLLDWICWIAEDGNTQETHDAIKPFLIDDRFRYVSGKHSGNPATPRNRAILLGNAPYIAFLDDDDLWLPEKLECQLEFLNDHPKCVLLGTNAYRWTGRERWDRSLTLYLKKSIKGKLPYKKLVQVNSIITSSAIIRREVIFRSGVFNNHNELKAFEDYELWLRIGSLGQIWLMHEPFVVYRDCPTSSIRSKADLYNYSQTMVKVFESALRGVGGVASPLSYAKNKRYSDLCRQQRDFYLTGRKALSIWGIARRLISSPKRYFLSRL